MGNYTIKKGDTLTGIAADHNTTVAALAKANNIKNPDLIYAGDTITVPGGTAKSSGRKTNTGSSIGTAYSYTKPSAAASGSVQSGLSVPSASSGTGSAKSIASGSAKSTLGADTIGTAAGVALQGAGTAAGLALGGIGSLIGAGEYVTASLKLRQLMKEKPTYAKSKDLLDLQAKIDAAVSAPPEYRDSYKELIDAKMKEIENREPFQYDFTVDPTYRAYRDRYVKEGTLAMEDAAANAAALSGGYGNSYGASAASQAYGDYLSKLNDVIPVLQEQAYERYRDEGDRLNQGLSDLRGLQEDERDAYKLRYSAYEDQLDDLFRQAENLSDEEWNEYLQRLKAWEYEGDMYAEQRKNAADAVWDGGKLAAGSLTDFGKILADTVADAAKNRREQEQTDYEKQRDAEKDKQFYDKLAWDKYKFYAKG